MIKKGLHKFAKGMFAIFTIKLVLVGILFLIQSCQNDNLDLNLKKKSQEELLASLELTKQNVNSIEVKRINNNQLNKNDLVAYDLEEVNTLSNLFELLDRENLTFSYNELNSTINFNHLNSEVIYKIPEKEIINYLNPNIPLAKNFLNTLGLSNEDISQVLKETGSLESSLIPFAMSLAEFGDFDNSVSYNFSNFLINSAHAQTGRDVVRCALTALGADLFYALGTQDATKWGKKALRKLMARVLPRFLGPIGVAITVGTFVVCMSDAALTQDLVFDTMSCDDLLEVLLKRSEFNDQIQAFYILKDDLSYINNNYIINESYLYKTYDVEIDVISGNAQCDVSNSSTRISGALIDLSSIREVGRLRLR